MRICTNLFYRQRMDDDVDAGASASADDMSGNNFKTE